MRQFGFADAASADDMDIDNPIYDLLIREEEVGPASRRSYEDLTHVDARLKSLEDTNPHRQALEEAAGSALRSEYASPSSIGDISQALYWLNNTLRHGFDPELVVIGLFSLVMGAATMAAGAAMPVAGPIAMMVGTAPSTLGPFALGAYAKYSLDCEQEVRGLVNDYLDFSDAVHKGREAFDETWLRLIGDEDRDRIPLEE